MKYILDLTKRNFDKVDFTEAKIIDFFCQQNIPQVLEFTVWGATLLLSPMWKHEVEFEDIFPKTEDLYVSGLGKIRVTNLVKGKIEIFVYDNVKDEQNRIVNAYNHDGTELVFRREWGNDDYEDCDDYTWECVITWPYGFCMLTLGSNDGEVTYEFDTDNLISAEKFRKNPVLYSF
ncbi:hypothetical protein LJC58_09960 [Lachnospiraceae bacterium OttesenSCG-928-D06]|nr:hypothetical protein [Lachnospiraceae bacterium OttesenSCG-928-D06]